MYTANWIDFIHTGILIVAAIFSYLTFRESIKSGGKLSPFILNTLFSKMVLRNEIIYWAKSKYGGYYVYIYKDELHICDKKPDEDIVFRKNSQTSPVSIRQSVKPTTFKMPDKL